MNKISLAPALWIMLEGFKHKFPFDWYFLLLVIDFSCKFIVVSLMFYHILEPQMFVFANRVENDSKAHKRFNYVNINDTTYAKYRCWDGLTITNWRNLKRNLVKVSLSCT